MTRLRLGLVGMAALLGLSACGQRGPLEAPPGVAPPGVRAEGQTPEPQRPPRPRGARPDKPFVLDGIL